MSTDESRVELSVDGHEKLCEQFRIAKAEERRWAERAANLKAVLLDVAELGAKFGGELTERYTLVADGQPLLKITGLPGTWGIDQAKLKRYNPDLYARMLRQNAGSWRFEVIEP